MVQVITVQDYKETYPSDTYQDSKIQQAINMSFFTIDGKYTANAISQRWELSEGNGGFNEKQKENIKIAFLIQSRYNLQTGLMLPEGNIQRGSGSQQISLAIPKRDEIYSEVIHYLELAGVSNTISGSSFTGKSSLIQGLGDDDVNLGDYVKWIQAFDSFICTQYTNERKERVKNKVVAFNDDAVAYFLSYLDLRNYVLPSKVNNEGKYLKILNGEVVWSNGTSGVDPEDYYTKVAVDSKLLLFQPKQDDNLETTSKSVIGAINEVKTLAEGRSIGYVIDVEENPVFSSDSEVIEASGFVDINSQEIVSSNLPVGAIIYVRDNEAPNRIYQGNNSFYIVDVETPDLTNYYTKNEIKQKRAFNSMFSTELRTYFVDFNFAGYGFIDSTLPNNNVLCVRSVYWNKSADEKESPIIYGVRLEDNRLRIRMFADNIKDTKITVYVILLKYRGDE